MKLVGATKGVEAYGEVVNRSLSPLHIGILEAIPGLRSPYAPWYDSVLQERLPSSEDSPWALSVEDLRTIVDGCYEDNMALVDLLSPDDAEEMKKDKRWWSMEPYVERVAVTEEEMKCTSDDMRRVLAALLMVGRGGCW